MESQQHHLKLLGACAQGDRRAFADLYEATSGKLFAVSLQMLQQKDLAEDVLQDAFVKIWHNASEYRDERGTVLTWMVSIVRYRALDILRSKKSRQKKEVEEQDNHPEAENHETPEINLTIKRDRVRIDDCMDHLEKSQADAIQLAYFNGFTHHEVCTHLNTPLGSVKSWIRRGLQRLKRCLEQ